VIRFLDIRHLAGSRELFSGLNWHIKPGERVGLVGDNGTGKTTLLRMAVGETEPTDGKVVARRNSRIGYLKQEAHTVEGSVTVLAETMKAFEEEQEAERRISMLYEELAHAHEGKHLEILDRIHVLETRIVHHDAGSAESDARRILAGLGFGVADFDRPLAEFSGGWQMRAQIARLLLERPDLLLLDEPTNHLDLESIEWLEEFLKGFPGALVVVSHDRYFLDRITTRTALIAQKKLRVFAGNYSSFLRVREDEEEQLLREYENQQREIARIEQFVERFRYKATKAASVQSRVKMLEKMERIELPAGTRRMRLRIPDPAPCGRNVLELREISKSYDNNRVFAGVDLIIEQGDKIALVGKNGAGKSTLLKICASVLDYEGQRIPNSKTQVEYFSQHRIDMLNPENTVLEEARPSGATQTDERLRSVLGSFLFSGDDVHKPVSVLSGGEKSRLALARMMLRRGNLLLLDEPTNHLDIATREVLQNALREFPGTIVMISHDRYFIDAIANKIIEVAGGEVRLFAGNYSYYLEKKRELEETRTAAGSPPGKQAFSPDGAQAAIALANRDRQESKRAAAGERQERTKKRVAMKSRLDALQAEIERAEIRLAEIHALQADPDAYAAGKVTNEIGAEARHLERSLPAMIEEWETLVEGYEAVRGGNRG
jgi:ATP-binding cassette subfamily F protein 3